MAWQILAGVVEWWADEGLRDVGRQRFHREPRGELLPRGSIDYDSAAFVVSRTPWRMAQIRMMSTKPDAPAVIAWADEATAVLTGNPAHQLVVGPNELWGDLILAQMLEPHSLDAVVPSPWQERFRIDGPLLEQDGMRIAPGLVSLASDEYVASFDPDLDVLTEWTALIDGEAAQRIRLTQLGPLG